MGKLRKPARKLAEGCRDGIQKYVCASHAVRVAMSANAMGGGGAASWPTLRRKHTDWEVVTRLKYDKEHIGLDLVAQRSLIRRAGPLTNMRRQRRTVHKPPKTSASEKRALGPWAKQASAVPTLM